jgi:hypothetical protein
MASRTAAASADQDCAGRDSQLGFSGEQGAAGARNRIEVPRPESKGENLSGDSCGHGQAMGWFDMKRFRFMKWLISGRNTVGTSRFRILY